MNKALLALCSIILLTTWTTKAQGEDLTPKPAVKPTVVEAPKAAPVPKASTKETTAVKAVELSKEGKTLVKEVIDPAKKVMGKKLADLLQGYVAWWYLVYLFILGFVIQLLSKISWMKKALKEYKMAIVIPIGVGLSFIPHVMTGPLMPMILKPVVVHIVIALAISAVVAGGHDTKVFKLLWGVVKGFAGKISGK